MFFFFLCDDDTDGKPLPFLVTAGYRSQFTSATDPPASLSYFTCQAVPPWPPGHLRLFYTI